MELSTDAIDPVFNTREAAAMLGVSPATMTTWRVRGIPGGRALHFRKVGRRVVYALSDIRDFLDASRRANTVAPLAAA
jgi:hypothetical protein